MKDYKEFTFGWITFISAVPIYLYLTYFHPNRHGHLAIGTTVHLIFTLMIVIICLLFYGLTTKVSSDAILISFGVGLIRKRIKLNRITGITTVTSPWYYGWGIRLIPNGLLYNISGTAGVELRFNDTNRIIRIGSPHPSALRKAIEERLKAQIV